MEPTPDVPETVGYTERVAVSGGQQIEQAVAKSDTGARRTSIDTDLAAAIGAGPVVDTASVKSGTSDGGQKRPLVTLHVRLGDYWHRTTASIVDRSHLSYPVLLGRDLLRGYRVDVEERVTEE